MFRRFVQGDDHEEAFLHDVRGFHDALDEIRVGIRLVAQEVIGLLLCLITQGVDVRIDIDLRGADDHLDGKIERVHESLIPGDDAFLFRLALQVEVDRFHGNDGAEAAVLQNHRIVAHFRNREKALGGSLHRGRPLAYRILCLLAACHRLPFLLRIVVLVGCHVIGNRGTHGVCGGMMS